MKIINISKNSILADDAQIANTISRRLIGLLNRSLLDKGEALVLQPSNSIHSFFMRFTFDALFLDKSRKVIAVLPSFKPFRISRIYLKSVVTIELPEGTISTSGTQVGDHIQII